MGSAASKVPTYTAQSTRTSVDEKQRDTRDMVTSLRSLSLGSPQSADGTITAANVANWESDVAANPKLQLTRTILNHTHLQTALLSRAAHIADQHVFNTEVDFKTNPITNQKSSGRCWLFASTNVLRYNVMKKLNLSEFQLSQSYLFFWDKLNKSNYFLENTIELADAPIDDRLVNYLAGDLISDGGQWDMVVNLVETYGVVPQSVFPESFHSSMSAPLNTLLKTKLREDSLVLRSLRGTLRATGNLSEEAVVATLRAKKEEQMKEIYTIISSALGVPPSATEKFSYDYYDKDGKPGHWEGTPKQFYSAVATDKYSPADAFSLINDPRNDYGKLYTVNRLGNLWGGRPVLYVNTEIDDLKNAVVKMLKAGLPVFFGCDVGKYSDKDAGIMDTALYEYENAFDITLGLSKADRLRVNESSMTHAMVISGVHLDSAGKPLRYKVENSWGETAGEKGYFVMTDKWFDEFVYQVVVPKQIAPKHLVSVYEGSERVVLPAWDPMGSLA
ncbi:hypothetical protein EIP91_011688 [Steccherinum ochraceum]|uniref:Cysteine proteinase 1, mitochondrial n=1 Tax=Steccherinum ochraceum TaxID=92696 RepID=A0A4R0RQN7_9APHY|nr:hypothetical protein EIP91_011688 [Steccherinum ochraceum]